MYFSPICFAPYGHVLVDLPTALTFAYNPTVIEGLFQTKLFVPARGRNWVARPRLLKKLNDGLPCKMILVSAPAGYGKTTLTTAWLAQLQQDEASICWVALDEDDSDPQQFFRYMAAAIEPLPGAQSSLAQILQSNQAQPAKGLIQRFISDISTVSSDFFLVLDDYHRLDSAEIDLALTTLLDYMPTQMTLVMTSRSDPGFPISRLRARRDIIEIRAEDLRFTTGEAAQFFEQTMGLTLRTEQIEALEERTEGWIAGLQMAALALQGRSVSPNNHEDLISRFGGSHRFVLDYLVEEALSQQQADVRDFLLATSILDQLNADLCDAVTERTDSQALLEQLERDNLFLIPLDDERHRYRYHHLFGDVLRAYAQSRQSDQRVPAHGRAAAWFAEQEAYTDAIRHALAAGDFDQTATYLEQARLQTEGVYQLSRWIGWLEQLPSETVDQRPVLCVSYAWSLLEVGRFEPCEPLLQTAERWLADPSAEPIIAVPEQWVTLPSSIEGARAYLALAAGRVGDAIEYGQSVLQFFDEHPNLPQNDHWRGVALSLLGLTFWMSGDLNGAMRPFKELTSAMSKAGKLVDAASTAYMVAEIQITQGDLSGAESTLREMLAIATRDGEPYPVGTSDLYRALASIAWERGEREAAETDLAMAKKLTQQGGLTNAEHRLYLTESYFSSCLGDYETAFAKLDDAERVYMENPVPNIRPPAAIKAQFWMAQGEVDKVAAWAKTVANPENISYLREFELLTFARYQLLYSSDQQSEGWKIMMAIRQNAIEAKRLRAQTYTLLLEAIATNKPESLAEALSVAEPLGFVQLFLNEGQPLAKLLEQLPSSPYRDRLLAYFGNSPRPDMVELLSEREIEILKLIADGMKNKEVADTLFISLNTVLYHTKNIYGKLGVNKRTLALAKAKELKLI